MRTIVLLMCCCLTMAGCGGTSGTGVPYADTGTVHLQAQLDGAKSMEQIHTGMIIFNRGRHSLEKTVSVQGQEITASFSVPVGTWSVEMTLYDENGHSLYQDKKEDVAIRSDQPVTLELALRPADGTIALFIDLSQYPLAHEVLRARVYFDERLEEITRESLEEPLADTYQVPPGSYSFAVQLYTDSFRISDQIHAGAWHLLDVEAASETTLQWSPALESLTISAAVHELPPAPQQLTAIGDGQESIELTWAAVDGPIQGYRVFWQPDVQEPFEQLTEEPIAGLSFVHGDSVVGGRYTVAAVSSIGIEGYRAQPQDWNP